MKHVQRWTATLFLVGLAGFQVACTNAPQQASTSDASSTAPSSGNVSPPNSVPFSTVATEGKVLWVRTTEGGPDILHESILIQYQEQKNCWIAQLLPDHTEYPVIWPSGSSFENTDKPSVVLSDGTVVNSNDTISGGGSTYMIDVSKNQVPSDCISSSGKGFIMTGDYKVSGN